MFVLNPDPLLLPSYRISPFTTPDLGFNRTLSNNTSIDEYFSERFGERKFQYTYNGREALNIALSYYNLKQDDIVTILTTTGNFYISQCVTNEIIKFCKWARKIEPKTKLILVNHEFGYPYKNLNHLKEQGIPIIEDCAYSFFSENEFGPLGKIGDFVIYSFPKMFPLQIGGLLVSNILNEIENRNPIDENSLMYIKKNLSHHIKSKEKIINKRIDNYKYLRNRFETLGFTERFFLTKGAVPGVFMFRTNKQKLDLPELKKNFYAHGVQCSVFYGEEAFFIPVHQSLNEQDIEYFYEVMKSFINQHAL
ncbi:MAG: DegT/DnrJ/EryC1/StrS family aminotransferase [Bacteroidales bacterium]|nr:DegT/DnrJ/EryC1/StrS family aminotransferase [Bacteroidales bacterium]MCF8390277.1 DegT/DnrJ/EryC1/StrS family aminotransferase [Bacteroidales bacterium]